MISCDFINKDKEECLFLHPDFNKLPIAFHFAISFASMSVCSATNRRGREGRVGKNRKWHSALLIVIGDPQPWQQ